MSDSVDVWSKERLLRHLELNTARSPLSMQARERFVWASDLALICERLADISRRRAKELESAYWTQAEEAMLTRRPRVGLKPRSREPLDADELRRARINAGTMLSNDGRFKDACNANEMYNRWAMQYAALATMAAAHWQLVATGA